MHHAGSVRALGLVYGTRIAGAGMALLATVLVARALGPERFGAFAVLLAVLNVTTGLVSPAIDTALVRFAAPRHGDRLSLAVHLLRAKALLALLTGLAGLALAVPLHRMLFRGAAADADPGASAFVVLFTAAAVMMMWSAIQAWYRAEQRFERWSIQEVITALLRLGWVAALLALSLESERALLAGYGIAAGAVAWAGATAMPRGLWKTPQPSPTTRREVRRFTAWVVVACCATALAQRLDVLLLAAWAAPAETLGHYGAAVNLALVGELAVMTLSSVLLPRASALGHAALRPFLHRNLGLAALFTLLLAPLALAGVRLAVLAFGADYAAAGPYFALLLLATAGGMLAVPSVAVLYAAGNSRAVASLETVHLALLVIALVTALPTLGALGVAGAVAAARLVHAGLACLTAYRILARPSAAPADTSG